MTCTVETCETCGARPFMLNDYPAPCFGAGDVPLAQSHPYVPRLCGAALYVDVLTRPDEHSGLPATRMICEHGHVRESSHAR